MNITAAIINYNNSEWISEAIASIKKQTRQPNELIIVDDCSTDQSLEKIKKELEFIKIPVKVIKHEYNKGASAARNTAIKESNHPIIAFLDGDDVYYRTKIEKSMVYLEKYPAIGLVYSDYDTQENGSLRREFKYSFDMGLMKKTCLANSNSLIRKSVFDRVGLFNEDIRGAEDYDMWIRIAAAFPMIHIPEALFMYRMHGNNFTITNTQQVIENTKRLQHAINATANSN